MVQGERLLIIGNSGSGKTWLSNQVERRAGLRAIHLDDLHWQPGRYGLRRDEADVLRDVAAAAAADDWVIEGVYGWLATAALPRATMLVWLDLPEQDCIANVRARGRQGGDTEAGHAALLDWVAGYWQRTTSSSHAGHQSIYAAFAGAKARLKHRRDVTLFLERFGRPVDPAATGAE